MLVAQEAEVKSDKKEKKIKKGIKWTGLPLPSYNSDDGFGFGARVYATNYQEGYAPYKWQIWAQYYKTTKKRENHEIKADILRFLGTPFRVVIRGGYVRYQAAQYYGTGNYQDMQRITRIKKGEIPINENIPRTPDLIQLNLENVAILKEELTINEKFDYNPGRRVLRERQNKFFFYDRVEPQIMASTEDWIGRSNFKWWVGIKGVRYRINSYYGDYDDGEAEANSKTLLDLERPTGYAATQNRRFVNLVRGALVYDSRPRIREKNPNSGIFSDIHFAAAGSGTGSHYTFEKVTFTFRKYTELFSSFFNPHQQEFVVAFRLQGQKTTGNAPFFELNRIYTKEEEAEGLGGTNGLRGYPSNQFVDNIMVLGNGEIRYTFSQKPWLGGMDWVMLVFYDVGRVAPEEKQLDRLGWHKAYGGGIRLVWEINTVVNISYGRSKFQTFIAFDFGHMF